MSAETTKNHAHPKQWMYSIKKNISFSSFNAAFVVSFTRRYVMILLRRSTRTSLRAPRSLKNVAFSSLLETASASVSNGQVARTSIANYPFKYVMAMRLPSLISSPVVSSMKVVRKLTKMSTRKSRSMRPWSTLK